MGFELNLNAFMHFMINNRFITPKSIIEPNKNMLKTKIMYVCHLKFFLSKISNCVINLKKN